MPKISQSQLRAKINHIQTRANQERERARQQKLRRQARRRKTKQDRVAQLSKGEALKKEVVELVQRQTDARALFRENLSKQRAKQSPFKRRNRKKYSRVYVVPAGSSKERAKGILVAGPFIGELGWECFSWQPIVRKAFLEGKFKKCFVYGSTGKSLMYNFATVIGFKSKVKCESECNTFHGNNREFIKLSNKLDDLAAKKYGSCCRISPKFLLFGAAHYALGKPDKWSHDSFHPLVQPIEDKKTLALCIRDRKMAKFRNWPYSNWVALADCAISQGLRVVILGQTKGDIEFPKGTINLLNKTTLDDVIRVFGATDLALGGSTGLLHMAARCGVDHVAWATSREIQRYKTTNWFVAKSKVYPWGWNPKIGKVKRMLKHWASTGEYISDAKNR
jgi:hypothetical protein